jgi:hypothetical protein
MASIQLPSSAIDAKLLPRSAGADLYDTVQTSTGQNHANPLDSEGAARFGVDRKWTWTATKAVQIAACAVFRGEFPNTVP